MDVRASYQFNIMFPFSTNRQKILTYLSEDEIKTCLKKYISEKRLFQIPNDFELYGKIQSRYSKFALGQFPFYNSFRPVVVISWNKKGPYTEINSYFRLDFRIIIQILIIPVFGIYLSLKQHIIAPFITMLLFSIFLIFVLCQFFYRVSKKSTLDKLDILLKDLNTTK
jgi:hypothetical protein